MSENEIKKRINPVEFLDKSKKINPVEFLNEMPEKPKDPEKKIYIVFYYATEEGKEVKSFEELVGRTEVYNFIKNMVENIDIYQSKVLVETLLYKDAISIYEFMAHVSNFYEDTFDIEEFNYLGLNPEQLEKERNDKNGL